jgi:hypothetical protein
MLKNSIVDVVELLLRKWREQQAKTVELLGSRRGAAHPVSPWRGENTRVVVRSARASVAARARFAGAGRQRSLTHLHVGRRGVTEFGGLPGDAADAPSSASRQSQKGDLLAIRCIRSRGEMPRE